MLNESLSKRQVAIQTQKELSAVSSIKNWTSVSLDWKKFKVWRTNDYWCVLISQWDWKSFEMRYGELQIKMEEWNLRILSDFKKLLRTSEIVHLKIDWIIMDTFTKKPCPFSNPPLTEAQKQRFYS